MVNWPAGTRRFRPLPNGLGEMIITLRNPEEVKAWVAIVGDEEASRPAVAWSGMTFQINEHKIICQADEEWQEWQKTFPQGQTHAPFAQFIDAGGSKLLVFGAKPVAGALPQKVVDDAPNFEAMDVKALRTYAATIGVANIKITESRGQLLERVKTQLLHNSGSRMPELMAQLSGKRMAVAT